MSPSEIGAWIGGAVVAGIAAMAAFHKLLPKQILACPLKGDAKEWVGLAREIIGLQRETRDELRELRGDLRVQALRLEQLTK